MYSRNAASVRRLNFLNRILEQNNRNVIFSKNLVRGITHDGILTIDNVSREIRPPQHPEYVPRNYCKSLCGQEPQINLILSDIQQYYQNQSTCGLSTTISNQPYVTDNLMQIG